MLIDDELKQHEKLVQLIREAIQHDVELREKYHVGNKFRFVQDRLHTLLDTLETQIKSVKSAEKESQKKEDSIHHVLVYVYLYNAQGLMLRSWSAMLTPKVFYEYSVNRPIYAEKKHIEALIKSKTNKQQHGYLTIAVHRDTILTVPDTALKDTLGNSLIKVREGSLHFTHLVAFTHNGQDYVVNSQGELVKKANEL